MRWLMCLFGFHAEPKLSIDIIDVRYASHAVEYRYKMVCPHCLKVLETLENKY